MCVCVRACVCVCACVRVCDLYPLLNLPLQIVLNPRDGHFEVPLYMLSNAEMHAKRIRQLCGDTQNTVCHNAMYLK